MLISTSLLNHACEVAMDAALQAGNLLREEFHYQNGSRGYDRHTAYVDQVAEEKIRSILLSHFPEWDFQGEETKKFKEENEKPYWSVDPNDGTAEFLKGQRGFSVSIGLVENGEPVLGVVYAPCSPDDDGDLITYFRGGPLKRNHIDVKLFPLPSRINDQILFASLGADKKPSINLELIKPSRYRCSPSIAYRLALTAVGEADIAISINCPSAWDIAGGHAILLGAGMDVMNEHLEIVRYKSNGQLTSKGKYLLGGHKNLLERYCKIGWSKIPNAQDESVVTIDPKYPIRLIRGQLVKNSLIHNRANGVFIAAVAGDSIGSHFEFQAKEDFSFNKSKQNLTELVDGGVHNLIAGQGTDDTEMAVLLTRAMIENNPFTPLNSAKNYCWWYNTNPFGIGFTISNSLRKGVSVNDRDLVSTLISAAQMQHHSKANGALMRAFPIAIYSVSGQSDKDTIRMSIEDASLTHSNPICLHSNAVFVLALKTLIQTGDREKAFLKARNYALKIGETDIINTLDDSKLKVPERMDDDDMGYVLYALQNAFYHLLHTDNAEIAISETIQQGGDTDTNALICGAFMGAIDGFRDLPLQWKRMILSAHPHYGFSQIKNPRPPATWAVDALQMVERLSVASSLSNE